MTAVGRHLLFRQLGLSGVLLVAAVVVAILLVQNWSRITEWLEERWRRRGRGS